MSLFEYCVFAQRLRSTRLQALDEWVKKVGPVSTREFSAAWRAARAAEGLASRYPGLRATS
jgi:hypothetical protein